MWSNGFQAALVIRRETDAALACVLSVLLLSPALLAVLLPDPPWLAGLILFCTVALTAHTVCREASAADARFVRALILQPDGSLSVHSGGGIAVRARLTGGWTLGRGRVFGLAWRTVEGGSGHAILNGARLDSATRRRLLVRVRFP